MSWLWFCGISSNPNRVCTPFGFAKQFSPSTPNYDIFSDKSEREEREHEEINNPTKFKGFEKVV